MSSNLNRRQILKQVITGSAALATGVVVPSNLLASAAAVMTGVGSAAMSKTIGLKDSSNIFSPNTNNSNRYVLSFETVSGIQYSVQKTTNLGVWSNVWSTSGDGFDKTFQEQASDRAFYRILQH